MSERGKDASKERDSTSRRSSQTEADRALESLLPAAEEFQEMLARLIRGHKNFKLRLEIAGDRGRVTDIDVNVFTKRRPHTDPKPTTAE